MNIKNHDITVNELFKASKLLVFGSKLLVFGKYLITVFPFYAILINKGLIGSPLTLLLLIPFIPMFTAGFMYNTLCDAKKDPKEKNPISHGSISPKLMKTCILVSYVISILIFVLIYLSTTALLLFLFLIFLSLSYSGLKVRFKETIIGPVVSSLGFFVVPSAIILSEFNYFDYNIFLLFLGLLFIYTGHEIKHTILEYELDLSFDCRTFAVIIGKKIACISEYVFISIGFIFLLITFYYFTGNLYLLILFTIIFLISLLATIFYGIHVNFNQSRDIIFITIPYIATRVYIIVLGCLILELPELLILFIMWILFTDKYL